MPFAFLSPVFCPIQTNFCYIMVSQFPNLSWDTVWEILDMNPVQMVDEFQWKTS